MKALGYTFLIEAMAVTIGVVFTARALTLVGITPFYDIAESKLSPTFLVAWGIIVTVGAPIGYYFLAYSFLRFKWWGVPLSFSLNTLFFIQELWEFLSPLKLDANRARVLVETLAASAQYQFNEQLFKDVLQVSNQPVTPTELVGRACLVTLLLLLLRRPELKTIMK